MGHWYSPLWDPNEIFAERSWVQTSNPVVCVVENFISFFPMGLNWGS